MAENVTFMSDGLKIEGLYEDSTGHRGVLIAHPHPLYGGDMYNPIVESLAVAYQKKSYATFRINFRGVGISQGGFDNGIGEQNDVLAGIDYLKDRGKSLIDLAGYSFGTGVIAQVASKDDAPPEIQRLIMISPPMGRDDSLNEKLMEKLVLVVTGSQDHIAPPDRIEKWLSQWRSDAKLAIIEGADHFYGGGFHQLAAILDAHI